METENAKGEVPSTRSERKIQLLWSARNLERTEIVSWGKSGGMGCWGGAGQKGGGGPGRSADGEDCTSETEGASGDEIYFQRGGWGGALVVVFLGK